METAYEAVFIIDAATAEDQVKVTVDKYTNLITNQGGTVDDVDRWDPRRLAYEIKKRREGLYFIVNFRSEPPVKDELDRIFRISDDTLRHIIVKQDKKADRFPSKIRAAEMERREREFAARAAAAPPAPAASAEPVTDLSAPASAGGVSGESAAADEVTTAAAPTDSDTADTAATGATDGAPAEAPAPADGDNA